MVISTEDLAYNANYRSLRELDVIMEKIDVVKLPKQTSILQMCSTFYFILYLFY